MNCDGGHPRTTLQALERRHLITAYPETITFNDGLPPMTVTRYFTPLPVHIAWCEWCSEVSITKTGTPKMKPISPAEAVRYRFTDAIPPCIYEVFNTLILAALINGRAVVKQEDVVAKLEQRGFNRQTVFANGWLNIEAAYREIGWRVDYERPAFNESGHAFFTFIDQNVEG